MLAFNYYPKRHCVCVYVKAGFTKFTLFKKIKDSIVELFGCDTVTEDDIERSVEHDDVISAQAIGARLAITTLIPEQEL